MISLDINQTSNQTSKSKILTTEEEPKLSFSDLLKGFKTDKNEKIIKITSEDKIVKSDKIKDDFSEQIIAKEFIKNSDDEPNETITKVISPKENFLSLLKNEIVEENNIKTFSKQIETKTILPTKEIKALIIDAKDYLKTKIVQSDGFKRAETKELPKTLKGLVVLAEKFNVNLTKITLEDVKSITKNNSLNKKIDFNDNLRIIKTPINNLSTEAFITRDKMVINKDEKQNIKPLEQMLKISNGKKSEQKVENPKEIKLEKKLEQKVENPKEIKLEKKSEQKVENPKEIKLEKKSEQKVENPKEIKLEKKSEQIVENPKEIKLEKKSEQIVENPKEIKLEKKLEQTVENPKEIKLEKKSEQIVENPKEIKLEKIISLNSSIIVEKIKDKKIDKEFKTENKIQTTKTASTFESLLRTEKPLNNQQFKSNTQTIFPSTTTSEITKGLESLLHTEKVDKNEPTQVTKLDGLTTQKVNDFEVKVNEAKQMIRYLSSDVKTAIEDYKSPFTRIKLQLNPQKLGDVEVTMVQRGSNLHVSISSNQVAINTLAMNMNELRVQLSNSGINNATLNFNNTTQSSDSNANQQQQNNQHEQRRASQEYDYFDNKKESNEEVLNSLEIVVPNYA